MERKLLFPLHIICYLMHILNNEITGGLFMEKKRKAFSFLFLSPSLIIYTVLIIVPMIIGVYYSLTEWDGISKPVFTGIVNYKRMFTNADYWKVFGNTAQLFIYTLVFQFPIGLILAYLLFRLKKGFKFFRTIYFFPVVVAPIIIGVMFSLILNGDTGALNKILGIAGLGALKHSWLSNAKVVLGAVIFPQVWQYIGLYVMLFLAAMFSIPKEIFESAEIDGASSFRVFFNVVIPLVKDIVQIAVILILTGSLKSFDYAWGMTLGGPGYSSSYLAVYMYKEAFVRNMFGYASAVTVSMLGCAIILTILINRLFKKLSTQY